MENRLSFKRTLSRVGLCFFTLMLVTQLLQTVASLLLTEQLAAGGWWIWIISYVPLYGIAFPVFLVMMKKLMPDGPGAFGTAQLTAGGWVRLLFLSLGLTYIGNIISTGITMLIGLIKGSEVVNPLAAVTQSSGTLPTFLFACVVAPVAEEFIFRKLIHDKIGRFGPRCYMLVSAFIFAMFHANLSQLLYAFVLGLLFAYVYVYTGKLVYTIALHVTINTIGSVLMPLLAMSGDTVLTAAAGFLMIVLIAIGIVLAVRRRWRFAPETAPQAAAQEEAPAGEAPEQKPLPQTFGGALRAPGMIAYTVLCAVLILIVTLM